MSYILMVVVFNTIVILLISWHGMAGAIVWGLNILLLDFFWQWLRWRRLGNAKSIGSMVISGYWLRVASVLLLLKVGQAWLLPQSFWVCAAITILIPVTGILGAYMLMQRGFK